MEGLPHRVRKKSGGYNSGADAIQVMTIKVSKGLKFPVVALPGVGHMSAPGGGREGSGAGVLCGSYSGYAEVGDGSWWGKWVWPKA